MLDLSANFLIISALPIIWALTMHEFMHAWVAMRCGDNTAFQLGRVNLNPLRHLDPLGTACLFFAGFGWAKPVPVNPANFRRPRLDDILVSAAGPSSNLILALALCVVFRSLGGMVDFASLGDAWKLLLAMASVSVLINFILFAFNLLPFAPLDGHHIVREMLPLGAPRAAFVSFSRIGPIFLLGYILLSRSSGFGLVDLVFPVIIAIVGHDGFGLYANSYLYALGG